MKTVYTCFTTDVIHEGHLNIIRQARKYGQVIVGVLTDQAMIRFDRFPTISFEERLALVRGLEGVSRVVVQDAILYDDIIRQFHLLHIADRTFQSQQPVNTGGLINLLNP